MTIINPIDALEIIKTVFIAVSIAPLILIGIGKVLAA
jgi:hypothetical protein